MVKFFYCKCKFFCCDVSKICAFREILTKKTIGIFVCINTFDKMLPILGERTWSLIISPPEGPEFICSDHPVTINWKSGRKGPIGLGLRETEVFFPLSRRAGFYGTFEDPLKEVVHAKPGNVATMNRRVMFNAERHLFSPLESFVMWIKGEIKTIKLGDVDYLPMADGNKNMTKGR